MRRIGSVVGRMHMGWIILRTTGILWQIIGSITIRIMSTSHVPLIGFIRISVIFNIRISRTFRLSKGFDGLLIPKKQTNLEQIVAH